MSYTWECTPPERADAVAANKILIPEKSRHMYEQAYRHYREYCRERKITREHTMLKRIFLNTFPHSWISTHQRPRALASLAVYVFIVILLKIFFFAILWCDQPIDDTPNRAWCNFFFAPKTRVDLTFNSKDDPKCRAGWACRTIYVTSAHFSVVFRSRSLSHSVLQFRVHLCWQYFTAN